MQEDKPQFVPRSDAFRGKAEDRFCTPLHITGSMISSERLTCKCDQTLSQAEVHTKLLDAFQLIVRVPFETLLAHRREAVLAFDKLRPVVSADTVPGADSPIEDSSSDVLTLLQSLNRSQTEITEHLSLPEVNAVGECPERESREPPIHNSDTANPTGSSSKGVFRKGLSLRRWALDYEKWELANHGTSRVNILLQNVDQDQRSRDGYVSLFVKGTSRISQSDQAARKDVKHGIKMLVFERLYQRTAVSAVLSFACTRFRNLKFRDLPLLRTMLEKSPWISEILMQKERWYQRCQEHYDGSSPPSKMSSSANIPAACHKTKRPAELDMASEPNAKRIDVVDEGNKILGLAHAAHLSSSELPIHY